MTLRKSRSERCQQSDDPFHRLMLQLGLSRQESITLNENRGNDYSNYSHLLTSIETQEEKEFDRPSSDSTPPSASESSDLSLPLSFQHYRKHEHDDVWNIPESDQKRSHADSAYILRRFYQVQVQKIMKRLEACQLNYERSEMKSNEDRIQLTHTIERLTKLSQEVQSKYEKLIHENQTLKNQLNMEFLHLTDLNISDALATQLLRQSEDTLTLKEFVQLQLYTRVDEYAKKSKQQLEEIAFLRKTCEDCQREYTDMKNSNLTYRQEADSIERSLRHELMTAQSARDVLEQNVKKLCDQLHLQKYKNCGEYQNDTAGLESFEERNSPLKTKAALEEKLRSSKQAMEKLTLDKENLKQMVDLLQADKQFLEKSLLEHEASKSKWSDSENVLKTRIKELETSTNELLMKTTKYHDEIRATIENKLDITDRNCMMLLQKEIQSIRQSGNSRDEFETRKAHTKTLLEQLRLAETKISNLNLKLEKKSQELLERERCHSTSMASLETRLTMRQYEHTELQNKFEERCAELRKAKIQIDLLNQKLQIHQEEFLRLENTSNAKIASLETVVNEKTKSEQKILQQVKKFDENYNHLESESLEVVAHSELGHDITSITPCSDDRERHLRRLAREVAKYRDESVRKEQELKSVHTQLLESFRMNSTLQNKLDEVSQPQSYLVDKLREREAELSQSQSQLTEKCKMFQKLQETCQHTQQTLSRVLSQREEVEGLKLSLLALRRGLNDSSGYKCNALGGSIDKPPEIVPVSPAQVTDPGLDKTQKKCLFDPLPHNAPDWYSKLRALV